MGCCANERKDTGKIKEDMQLKEAQKDADRKKKGE